MPRGRMSKSNKLGLHSRVKTWGTPPARLNYSDAWPPKKTTNPLKIEVM